MYTYLILHSNFLQGDRLFADLTCSNKINIVRSFVLLMVCINAFDGIKQIKILPNADFPKMIVSLQNWCPVFISSFLCILLLLLRLCIDLTAISLCSSRNTLSAVNAVYHHLNYYWTWLKQIEHILFLHFVFIGIKR